MGNRRVLEKAANSDPDANSSEKMINFEVWGKSAGKIGTKRCRIPANRQEPCRPDTAIYRGLPDAKGVHNRNDRARLDEDRAARWSIQDYSPSWVRPQSPEGQKRRLINKNQYHGQKHFRARTEKRLGQLLLDDPAAPSFQA